jgi:NAD(P)H-dependent flavin oxidoreductase YrpB (nitropropane dioxygenase family)
MQLKKLPELTIGGFNLKIPVIQGGMGIGISLAGLASAVANEGGLGVISATGIYFTEENPNNEDEMVVSIRALKKEIKKAKELTDGIIGVNLLVALTDYELLLEAAFDAGADLFFLGAGLPVKFSDKVSPEKMLKILKRVVPIISSGRACQLICKTWKKKFGFVPEAFVIEGPLAGGHLGFKKDELENPQNKLENILPTVLDAVKPYETELNKKIPVIVGGGIFTGEDIYKYIKLGASGVQMGTRFVATKECDATDEFKNKYVECEEKDIIIIKSPVGLPGRTINNSFLEDVEAGNKKPFKCPWKCLRTCDYTKSPYCIAVALYNAKIGKMNNGFAFAGQNAYLVKEIVTVKELISTLKSEFEKTAENDV